MARRIRWQILIAVVSSVVVLVLMSYLAITTTAVQRPIEGGDYVEGLLYTPQQINPLIGDPSTDQGAADIQALIFDGLLRAGPSGLPEPALASSWTTDETGETYTFVLRDGVTWHDGTAVSSADVLFTIRAIQGPAFTGDPSLSAVWKTITVDEIDERTIRCRLSAPFAAFLEYATFPILPAHLLADLPPDQWSTAPFALAPIGTGPYRIDELSSQRALLRANPAYYRGRPFIDSIELRYYDQPQVALNDLVRGVIQGLNFTTASELRSFNLPRTIERQAAPLDGYTTLAFNLRAGLLADQGLRRALAIGTDREELIARVFDGQAGLIDTPILPQWWAAAPDANWPAASPERANQLLDELGYPRGADGLRVRDGRPLTIELITDSAMDRSATATEIARQWGLLGITVNIQTLDGPALHQRLIDHNFEAAIHAWQRLGGDPDVYALWHSDQADQGRNYAGLSDPEIDALLARARQEIDLNSRYGAYAAFQRRWIELVPAIPLYQPLLFFASSTALDGVAIDASTATEPGPRILIGREARFHDITRWFLRSAREIQGDLRQP